MNITTVPPQYVCINCGHRMKELFRKYTSHASVKTTVCERCNKISDKYIEYESIIVLVDVMLMSDTVFRHMLYNRDFKLHWKLSLVLLLLESFALWRRKRDVQSEGANLPLHMDDLADEKGFYICCLLNILDYITVASLLLCSSLALHFLDAKWNGVPATSQQHASNMVWHDLPQYIVTMLKSVAIANFSKFFILPIMVWGENTNPLGSTLHHLLVLAHHLTSLVLIFAVAHTQRQQRQKTRKVQQDMMPSRFGSIKAAGVVLPVYVLKEFIHNMAARRLGVALY